ncbi:MAG: tRNA uridine-5-carboxymethylaminomethyl(34) synthesis GTPase MnmE [Candidatus Cloacimonetes bacterium]|nr:tRNA uridine-5-carboxymethylaminomethyl(34) synthesis GTPase MnmE [Candidatus Cloacimonadota bacterium]
MRVEFYRDTIAAISTPSGKGGIHLIRVSGEAAIAVVNKIFKGKNLHLLPSHKITFGRIYDKEELLDEVLVTIFRSPHSYTGEDVVEISCHGNQFVAERILGILLIRVRLAQPGEFTQRAFLNDKMDLTQAEAVGDLLAASTRHSQRQALNQLEGRLAARIREYVQILTHYRLLLELEIDFSDDDTEELDYAALANALSSLEKELEQLAASGRDGLILREGYRVCLVGQPNVGKSSIFNKILETERAIVTPVPGTTRDYLEEALALEGFLVKLYDTAGIRDTEDEIEKIGITRSYDIIKEAHLLVYVNEGTDDAEDLKILAELAGEDKIIKVLNKSDILSEDIKNSFAGRDYLLCSTFDANGLQPLKLAMLNKIAIDPRDIPETLLSNSRQIAAVQKALANIHLASEALENKVSAEFIAFDLQEASRNLEDITGMITTDEILNRIFAEFCIGK